MDVNVIMTDNGYIFIYVYTHTHTHKILTVELFGNYLLDKEF